MMEVVNEGEMLAAECKNAVTVCGKQIDKQQLKQVKNDLSNLEKLVNRYTGKPEKMKEEDLPALRSAIDQLKGSASYLLQLYQQQNQGHQS